MIGVYDYTVILTFLSLMSGMLGSIISLQGYGHPYVGGFFLLFCGFCDTFDGIVARSKQGRSDREKAFGVQIDSLSDLVAFGVLPGCIGMGLLNAGQHYAIIPNLNAQKGAILWYPILFFLADIFYVLAAMIRLAYFNVLEEERQQTDPSAEKRYIGLPVTSAALVFPLILLSNHLLAWDLTLVYFFTFVIMSLLFLGRFQIRKPNWKEITILLIIGLIECILLIIL